MPYYAKCDVISGENKLYLMSHEQNVAAQKQKRTCITVLNILSPHTITIFVSYRHFKVRFTLSNFV